MASYPAPGTILLGKYRVDSLLGRGGMGAVVKAWHIDLEQPVAIKVLMPAMLEREEIVMRFLREAKAAAKLKSQHIALVIDVGRLPDSTPVIVMEFLDGADLGAIIKHHGAQDPQLAVDLLLQACEGLAEAHANGIIHRDVKSSNFFIVQKPNRPALLKVLDFGIATAPQGTSELTTTQSVMGTPSYMAPEQMRSSRDVDARSDIWSLGVVLYELLEGARPFRSEAYSELCLKVGMDPPVPMSRHGVPPELTMVVLKCLEKGLERRYQTVADLAWDLVPFASDPGLARGTAERCSRILGVPPAATRVWDGQGRASWPRGSPEFLMAGSSGQLSTHIPVALPPVTSYVASYVASPISSSQSSQSSQPSQPSHSQIPVYGRAGSPTTIPPDSWLGANHGGRWGERVVSVPLPTGPLVIGGTPTSVSMGVGQRGGGAQTVVAPRRGWLLIGAAAAVAIGVGGFFALATTDDQLDSKPTSESAGPASAGGVTKNAQPAAQIVPVVVPTVVEATVRTSVDAPTTIDAAAFDAAGSAWSTVVATPVGAGSGSAATSTTLVGTPVEHASGAAMAPIPQPVVVRSSGAGSGSVIPTAPPIVTTTKPRPVALAKPAVVKPVVVAHPAVVVPVTTLVNATKPVVAPVHVERKPAVVKKTDRTPIAPTPDDMFSKRK